MEWSRPGVMATSTLCLCILFPYLPICEFIIGLRVKTVVPINLPFVFLDLIAEGDEYMLSVKLSRLPHGTGASFK